MKSPLIRTSVTVVATVFILLIQTIGLAQAEFTDLGETYSASIEYLEGKGVIQGYQNGDFKPEKAITKAEFITMMFKNYDYEPSEEDIETAEQWYEPYLQKAWEIGVIEQSEISEPHETIRRVEAAEYMLKFLGIPKVNLVNEEQWTLEYRDVRYDTWYAPIILAAINYDLIDPLYEEDVYFRPFLKLTRGEATELMVNMDTLLYGNLLTDDYAELEGEIFGEDLKYDIPHLDILIDLWNRIHEEFYWQENVDDEALIYGALEGLIDALEDQYTIFLDPPDSAAYSSYLQGELSGIGAYITETTEGVVIQSFIAGAPAEESGLKVNDIIVEVDGIDVSESSTIEVGNLIRGEVETDVVVTVKRKGETETLSFTITRAIIDIGYVDGEIMGDALYIDINMFDALSFINFTQTTQALIEENPDFKGFVIDLRDNPGGYLSAVRSVIGHFIPNGYGIFYTVDADNQSSIYLSQGDGEWADYPMVLLINENSASAAELLAITMKEKNDALLVGKISYGKGTIQQIIYYADGSSVKMTIAEWRSAEYHSINGKGIAPHYDVDITEEDALNGEDPQLNKALEVLDEMIVNWEEEQAETEEEKTSANEGLSRDDATPIEETPSLEAV